MNILQGIRAKIRGARGEKHVAAVLAEFSRADAKLTAAIAHLDAEMSHNHAERDRLYDRNQDLASQANRALRVKGRISELVA